jgi:hypothetical protein
MEKLSELERSRDEAVQRLESTQRAAQRSARERELEAQQMENEIRDLR